MSNVITLRQRLRPTPGERHAALIAGFAAHRRQTDDVFWLKENAELLGILATTGGALTADALQPYATFYDQIEARMQFFPQYYRFLLSICLDLEDLGMPGDKGTALCDWAARNGLAEAEISDLQRAEARRLLARRGMARPVADGALSERLHRFMARTGTFAMPNKKAAYELTHIVFYLSEYGRRDPGISADAVTSLEFAGLLAYLDQNLDLLAEVCTALRFAGQLPSPIWESAVSAAQTQTEIVADENADLNDHYHEFLVTGWATRIAGQDGFGGEVVQGAIRFLRPAAAAGALRLLSECMYDLGATRNGDWQRMRGHVLPYLGQDGHEILHGAEKSTDKFEAFFEGFARAGTV